MNKHFAAGDRKISKTVRSFFGRAFRRLQSVNRLYSVFVHDLILASVAFFLSIQIVADIREFDWSQLIQNFAVFVCVAVGVFLLTGLYRWMWRFVSRRDTVMVFIASTILAVGFALLSSMMTQKTSIPMIFGLILWFALIACLLLPRFLFSFVKEFIADYRDSPKVVAKTPVLILGIGEKAARFIREHCSGRSAEYQAIGMIAHHADFIGRKVHGISILGISSKIEDVLHALKKDGAQAKKVLILEDGLAESDLNHLVSVLPKFSLALYAFSWQPGKLTKIISSKEG